MFDIEDFDSTYGGGGIATPPFIPDTQAKLASILFPGRKQPKKKTMLGLPQIGGLPAPPMPSSRPNPTMQSPNAPWDGKLPSSPAAADSGEEFGAPPDVANGIPQLPQNSTIQRAPNLAPPSPPAPGFMGRLKSALPGIIDSGIAGVSTPNIAGGKAVDIFRAMGAGRQAQQNRSILAAANQRQGQQDELNRRKSEAQIGQYNANADYHRSRTAEPTAPADIYEQYRALKKPDGTPLYSDDEIKVMISGGKIQPGKPGPRYSVAGQGRVFDNQKGEYVNPPDGAQERMATATQQYGVPFDQLPSHIQEWAVTGKPVKATAAPKENPWKPLPNGRPGMYRTGAGGEVEFQDVPGNMPIPPKGPPAGRGGRAGATPARMDQIQRDKDSAMTKARTAAKSSQAKQEKELGRQLTAQESAKIWGPGSAYEGEMNQAQKNYENRIAATQGQPYGGKPKPSTNSSDEDIKNKFMDLLKNNDDDD